MAPEEQLLGRDTAKQSSQFCGVNVFVAMNHTVLLEPAHASGARMFMPAEKHPDTQEVVSSDYLVDDSVTQFVERDQTQFLRRPRLSSRKLLLDMFKADGYPLTTCRTTGIARKAFKVSTRHALCPLDQVFDVQIGSEVLTQNTHTGRGVRQWDFEVPIQATRAEESWIEVVRIVRCSNDDNAFAGDRTVKAFKESVDDTSVPVVVPRARERASGREIVDFVNQQNGLAHACEPRRMRPALP